MARHERSGRQTPARRLPKVCNEHLVGLFELLAIGKPLVRRFAGDTLRNRIESDQRWCALPNAFPRVGPQFD
jgi:hypothetical protein